MGRSIDPDTLVSDARALARKYETAKESLNRLSEERIESINELREHEVSWAQIGRVFGISPQAAMYVSGHAKRTPAKSKAKGKKKG